MPPPQYSPPQRRRQSPPPSPGQDTSPRQRQRRLSTGNPNRDVRIHTNRPNSEWPDPTRIQPRAMAHIPIPATRHGDPRESVTNVPTAQGATDIHEANTYKQLWPLFESGALTVPDTFTRLYLTDRTNNSVHFIRSAAMGFATSRRIMQAANVSRHNINAFLITLATHEQQHPLNNGLWERYLRESMTPDQRSGAAPPPAENNWSEARRFAHHPATREPAYGLTFIPPRHSYEPWEVRTQWTADDFMRLIRRIRPSTQSLRWLTDYADVTVRTRHAEGPVPGLRIEGMERGRMFPAPFISARAVPNAFARPPARLPAAPEPTPTTQEENVMEVNENVEGGDTNPEETLPPPPPPKTT